MAVSNSHRKLASWDGLCGLQCQVEHRCADTGLRDRCGMGMCLAPGWVRWKRDGSQMDAHPGQLKLYPLQLPGAPRPSREG